jgi:hypothetical protein
MSRFTIAPEATPNTPINLTECLAVAIPIEYELDTAGYTVQRDNGTYGVGTFADRTSNPETRLAGMKITASEADAGLLQRFMFNNERFYLKLDNMDIFLNNSAGVNQLVRKKGLKLSQRKLQKIWDLTLEVELI